MITRLLLLWFLGVALCADTFYVRARSFVSCLLQPCGPSNITRNVVAVRINAVEGVVSWAFSNGVKESRKVINPFSRHEDAATTIEVPIFCIGVGAAFFHGEPTGILPTTAGPFSMAVFEHPRPNPFQFSASATIRYTRSEIVSGHILNNPARTPARPQSLSCNNAFTFFEHGPVVELNAG